MFTPSEEYPHPTGPGVLRRYYFPNGYEASVVRFKLSAMCGYGSYTSDETEWEVGVVWRGQLVYDTPITSDVVGHVKDGDELQALLAQIAALPPRS